jgi:hypothetical protein
MSSRFTFFMIIRRADRLVGDERDYDLYNFRRVGVCCAPSRLTDRSAGNEIVYINWSVGLKSVLLLFFCLSGLVLHQEKSPFSD